MKFNKLPYFPKEKLNEHETENPPQNTYKSVLSNLCWIYMTDRSTIYLTLYIWPFNWTLRSHVRLRNWHCCAKSDKRLYVRHPVRQHQYHNMLNRQVLCFNSPSCTWGRRHRFAKPPSPLVKFGLLIINILNSTGPLKWDIIALHFLQFMFHLSWNYDFIFQKRCYIVLDCFPLSNGDELFACI